MNCLEEMDQAVVDSLFSRLKAIFPKWREIWTSEGEIKAAKRQWSRALIRKGVADQRMIKMGLEKAEMTGWVRPPSPAQFCDWCVDAARELAGIPTREQAIDHVMGIAKKGDYERRRMKMDPPIYQICRYIDWFSFRRKKVEDAEKAIGTAYDKMIKHWMSGQPFDQQPELVEHHNPSGVVSPQARKKGKEALSKLLRELRS